MENNENNNLNELDQLKAQYETLKQQFDQQEIVNDRLMMSSIKSNVDFYMRYRWKQYILYPLGILVALLAIKWEFNGNLSLMLFYITFMLVSFAFEILMLRKLHVKTIENNDLLTLSNQARGFKKLYSSFWILGAVPMLILFVGLFSKARYDTHLPNLDYFIFKFCVALVIFVSVGIVDIRHKTKPCDEIIQQIEASGTTENRKTGFGKKQKWFCVAMIVAFLCLDVWAYMIVASHLKLPPMWRNVEYVRAENDFSTEGKLEIWEVFADTVIPEKDIPELRQILNDDSYILMEGRQEEKMEIGDDAMHSRRQDENNPKGVQLYLLKKNSQEGPAISSMAMEGKPMVQRVDVTKPPKYPSDGSVPIIVWLTPEAGQLWLEFTKHLTGKRGAVSIDGVVVQEWKIMSNLENGCFFIMREWSSKEELEAFCKQLIRQ